MSEIDILVGRLPDNIRLALEGTQEKIRMLGPFTRGRTLSFEKAEEKINQAFTRFNSNSRHVNRQEPTLVITSESEPSRHLDDVKWAVMLAGAMLDCYHCLNPYDERAMADLERQRILKLLGIWAENQTSYGYYPQLYSKLALQLTLLSDIGMIRNFYPNGNPFEPLVDLCVMGTRPLGIINQKFVLCVPQ